MSMPGFILEYEDFNDATFAASQTGYDPDMLRHQLADSVPARAPYFVDSGRKFSNLYRLFMTNFIDPSNNASTTSDESPTYRNALAAIYNADYTFTEMVGYVNRVRARALDTFTSVANQRRLCLLNENPGICAKKMSLFNQQVRDMNILYHIGRKYMGSAITSLLATQVKNANTIMTRAYQIFLENERSGVGGRSFMESYLLTKFDPSNFHCWWNINRTSSNCPTFDSAFSRIRITISYTETKTATSSTVQTFGMQARVSLPFIRVGSGSSLATRAQNRIQMTAVGSQNVIQFEVAQVRVYRPWLDASIFDYVPLGMVNTPKHFWSDGKFNGICPWYITKLIVAKNIVVQFSQTNTAFESAITASSVDGSVSIDIGPFKLNTGGSNSESSKTQSTKYDARTRTLTISGPQIIGYVATLIPAFPSYDAPILGK